MSRLFLASLICGAAALSGLDDLQRARTKVPRDEYRSHHPHYMGKVLNGHLRQSHPNVKACHEWSPAELQELQATLHGHRVVEHQNIYSDAHDSRALRFDTISDHQDLWSRLNGVAKSNPLVEEMQRDAHCREAVMWWVHHLSKEKRESLKELVVPALPLQEWREPIAEEGPAAMQMYKEHYSPSSTCLSCHGGGMPWLNNNTQPPALPRQVNNKDRQRRCDEYYGAEEGGACGVCDGISGAQWGDLPDEGIYMECTPLLKPEEVPEAERAPRRAWPKSFSVEMRGADRWPRAQQTGNKSCNYTSDCSPYSKEAEGMPLPPSVPVHWYASIHGVLYVDHEYGQYGGGRLRHETVYEFPSGPEGAHRAMAGRYGDRNVHLTEIHVQTPEMAGKSPADPGIMLNLEHQNMTDANKSGIDDSKLDWRRIPANDGVCVCVPDPSGLPYFHGAFDNATYLGRARVIPQWQTTGTGGPPTNKTIVVDHYVKWFFHMFVDVETYMPAIFSSAYGGTATFGNWTILPEALWPEWKTLPPRENCVPVTGLEKAPTCTDYVRPKEAEQMMV